MLRVRSAGIRPAAAGLAQARRPYYGWVLVVVLGITATVSYGILTYAFPVFIVPMGDELGWSKTAITGAFSLASLVAGLAAIPVGRWVDRDGARGVMTAGSVLAAATLLLWSRVGSLAGFYALAVALGLTMAAVLYEPAFAVIANWFVRLRGRALTVLTFFGGFASVIFIPLATLLVEMRGWREALVWLAAILAVITVPLHGLLLRRRPEDMGLLPDGDAAPAAHAPAGGSGERSISGRQAVRSSSFFWLAAAFGLSALVTTGVAVHLIPLLLERGYQPAFAGAAMGVMGLMALPGRLIFTPLGDIWSRGGVTAAIFLLQSLGLAVLLATHSAPGLWVFVALFGAGSGAITPARAALLAEFYGRGSYASIGGVLALVVALARSISPVGASLLHSAGGGYDAVVWTLLVVVAASGAAVLLAGRNDPRRALQLVPTEP
jgi:MFS family permease